MQKASENETQADVPAALFLISSLLEISVEAFSFSKQHTLKKSQPKKKLRKCSGNFKSHQNH